MFGKFLLALGIAMLLSTSITTMTMRMMTFDC